MFLLVGVIRKSAPGTFGTDAAGKIAAATTRRPECASGDRPLLDLAADLSAWEPAPGISAACIFAATRVWRLCRRPFGLRSCQRRPDPDT